MKLLPPEKQQLCDYNMLQWNRLARIPMTINYKEGKKAWAWIIQPKVHGWLNFKWEGLEPLNPADLPVAKIKVAIPTLQRHFIEPVDDATPATRDDQAPPTNRKPRRYEWVEKIIEKGLPDGRKRFILYVLSAYLVNVKRLSEEEAIQVVQEFLENSCRNYNNCEKICESFIRGDLHRVKSKGLRPVSLEKLREKDPELYSLITRSLA
ncbi:MAG: DNA primase noncatalytic subunit PriX [Desulfurococcaceae archaeon]|nr:DNA primase noncatalytic subunit PriX [Desulfurococcaceae archaeon]